MHKPFIAVATFLLLSLAPIFGQEYWSTVPAPIHAPTIYQAAFIENSDYTWLYPFTEPTPGGVIRVRNTIVDSNGKLGAWSEPKELTVKSGWRLWAGAWNQPVIEDASGIAWSVEVVSIERDFQHNPYKPGYKGYFYTGGSGGSYKENTLSPVSSHSPYLQHIAEDQWRYYTLDKFPTGGTWTTVSPAPMVIATNVPNEVFEIAYCRVTETGETTLSPGHIYLPDVGMPAGTTHADSCYLTAYLSEYHPQGTLGLHFYRRKQLTPEIPATETTPAVPATWGEWKRLPDMECYDTPSIPDHWLWPIWKRACFIRNYVEDAPTHQPAANPQSRLTKLHRLLRGDPVKDKDVQLEYFRLPDKIVPRTVEIIAFGIPVAVPNGQVDVVAQYDPEHVAIVNGEPTLIRAIRGNVIVKPGERFAVHCPVIDEWGNGDSGTTGAPPDQKFNRRIRASDFGEWFIDQQPSQSGHKSWPVMLIHNSHSRWSGVKVSANGGDALVYSDYSGGQAFGNQFRECTFSAPMSPGGRVTVGIRIDHACSNNHHPSEQLFSDCYANGGIGAILGGNQAANLRFGRMHINSYATDSRGSVFYLENPNPISMSDGIFCDAFINGARGVIFRAAVYGATLQGKDIWCDTGFVRLLESNGVPTQLELTGGKLNIRGTKPVLALFAGVVPTKSTLVLNAVQTQYDGGTEAARIINHNYRTVEVLMPVRSGLDSVVLKEPSEETATAMLRRFAANPNAMLSPREEPGYRVHVDVPVKSTTVTLVTKERTKNEATALYAAMQPKIPNLPEWGKFFLINHWFKYYQEPQVTETTSTVKVTSIYNSLVTGEKVNRKDIVFP
jgi:hypothetical protein